MTTTTVSSGVYGSGLTVGSGSELLVLSGGVAESATVSSGGELALSSGGVASATTISAGALMSGPGQLGGDSLDAGT
jgi:autotransporter passenger strand-loop-strand repeat protein